mmetsp:Transcript_643/g.1311  ORF Transcript_643/g.1311 Transcript_643/m.1311 type:complete len:288 (+) Transcript_643:200-1063(+)
MMRPTAPRAAPAHPGPRPSSRHSLQCEQGLLALQPAGIAGQRSVGTHHPVAGNQDGNRVAADRRTQGPGGTGAPQALGQAAIGVRGAWRDLQQRPPDLALEGRAGRVQRRQAEGPACEIGRQGRCGGRQHGVAALVLGGVQHAGVVLLIVEPQARKAGGAARGGQRAQRGVDPALQNMMTHREVPILVIDRATAAARALPGRWQGPLNGAAARWKWVMPLSTDAGPRSCGKGGSAPRPRDRRAATRAVRRRSGPCAAPRRRAGRRPASSSRASAYRPPSRGRCPATR